MVANKKSGGGLGSDSSKDRLDKESLERLAGVFLAFADATRLGILQELRSGRKNVGELVVSLGSSQANISKHLKQLHQAGLLVREKEGVQVFYQVAEKSVFEMCKHACMNLNANAPAPLTGDYFI